jgi:hypothetical protein
MLQSFAAREHVTPHEFNELLLEIVAMASLHFCQVQYAHGFSRAETNEALQPYIQALAKWQREQYQMFCRRLDEPCAPSYRSQ